MSRTKTNERRRPESLGSVELLSSGRFRAYYRLDGVKFTAPHTFDTRTAAQGWLATERADRLRGTWRDPRQGQETLADYLEAWIDSRRDLAPATAEGYRAMIERWIAPKLTREGRSVELGAVPLAALTPALVRRWFALVSECTKDAALSRLAGRTSRPVRRKPTHPARPWALAQGLDVPASGRLPAAILNAWRAAGSPAARDPRPRESVGAVVYPARALHPARVWALAQGLDVPASGRISPRMLDAWQAAGAPRPDDHGNAPEPGRNTAAHAYRTLNTAMNAAVRDGMIPANPCTIRGAGTVKHPERSTANPAEVAALSGAMPPTLSAAVLVAAWSSLRYGELFALARRHFDPKAGTLRVERALSRSRNASGAFGLTKTMGSVRTVYLPRFVVDALAAHLAQHTGPRPDDLIFCTATGQPITSGNLARVWGRARASIGRPELAWHDLRHTGATLAYANGASVREVQRRLGHTTARAAMIYAHAADDSDRIIAERMDDAYRDAGANVVPLRRVSA